MASSPWYISSVTTAATGSPTNRTTSLASSGCFMAWFMFGIIGGSGFSPASARSLAVYTASTPGASSAALTSMPLIFACATVERTKCT